MLVYIAGPYGAIPGHDIDDNIARSRDIAIDLWTMGHTAICPHLNTSHFEKDTDLKWDDYMRGDLKILARCDAIVMDELWEQSKGACVEREFAQQHNIPVYYYPTLPEIHPTEQSRPEQCNTFIDIVMRGYRVHLDKNADYSPANILGAGEIGLMTRVWDKISRLMNLFGFRVEIASSVYEKPHSPKNESIEDNILDTMVYSIIWQIFRLGKWGK